MSEEIGSETPSVESSIGSASPQAVASPEGAKEVALDPKLNPVASQTPAPYTPNHKFKVLDQEKEFDEWAKSAIKDAQTEKQIRQLYEKAHGLDFVKNDRTRLRSELEKVSGEHTSLRKSIDQLSGYVQKGDFESFFDGLKIPKEHVFKWVHDQLQLMQKPQHEQQAYHQLRQAEQRAQMLAEENTRIQSMAEQYAVNSRVQEMDSYLTQPGLVDFIKEYETHIGKPGSFRQAVIERGQYHAYTTGRDIPTSQAINEVLQMVGAVSPQQATQQASPTLQGAPTQQVASANVQSQQAPAAKKPTITNVQGRGGSSPVKRVPTSIEDLKKIRASMV